LLRCHSLNMKTFPPTNLTDCLYHLIGDTVDLTVTTFDGRTLAFLTIQSAHGFVFIGDEDAVKGVGHQVLSLDYLSIIRIWSVDWESRWTVPRLAHSADHSDTTRITFLLLPLLLFHVVDANSHTFRLVLYNNTIFHNGIAVNPVPTASDELIHAKEFVYTNLYPYRYPTQSETLSDDKILPHGHNNH